MMQVRAIVTMEGENETVPKLSNGTIFNNLPRYQGRAIIERKITRLI